MEYDSPLAVDHYISCAKRSQWTRSLVIKPSDWMAKAKVITVCVKQNILIILLHNPISEFWRLLYKMSKNSFAQYPM